MAASKYDLSKLGVIAVVFNPVKYRSRYDHYQKFQAHMAQSGVTLFTVECIFESAERFDLPRQRFVTTRADDPHHLQVTAPSILWMKENLINLASKYLPSSFEYIAWIDADIEFEHLDWPHRTIAALQRYPVVQLFEVSLFLGPEGKKDVLRRDHSFGFSIRNAKPIDPRRHHEWYPHPGYAWAMRRSSFDSIGGLLDFCIVGSGDLHFAYALLHRIEETLRPGLHSDYRQSAITWGQRVAEVAGNGANVGYVPVNVWHHWHGERQDRSYVDRWMILEKHQFSPINGLERNADTGLLRLNNTVHMSNSNDVRRLEALEQDIVSYFQSRNEDNVSKGNAPPRIVHYRPAASSTSAAASSRPFHPSTDLWISPSGSSYVDDDHPHMEECTSPEHCHLDEEHCDGDNECSHDGDECHHADYDGPGSFY